MHTLTGYIFSFLIDNIMVLYFIFVGVLLLGGLVYIIFPDFIKNKIRNTPSGVFRIFGGIFLILGIVFLLLYKEFLSTYF